MTWADHHTQSERLAAEAELAVRQGAAEQAVGLYRLAAEAEARALADLDPTKIRTLGITAVSAVALWYKAHDYAQAEHLAHTWLASERLPSFAVEQLRELLQMIWSARARERVGVKFTGGEVLVSVKGGEVVTGGAPLDLIVEKAEAVGACLYRTAEFLVMAPHRKHRPPSPDIQRMCRPWLFHAAPGSYQFAVRVQQPAYQMDLFPEEAQRASLIEKVIPTFLEIIQATADDPEDALSEVVADAEYRTTFLKLARNLAPTGKSFAQLEIKSVSARESKPIILLPGSRQAINHALKKQSALTGAASARGEVQLRGVLRALHLDKDWLEITTYGSQAIRIDGAGDEVDDVLGPMVNREVLVDVFVKKRGKKYFLRDIQAAE